MTREEAIKFAVHAQSLADLPEVKEFYAFAESAIREQEERRWIPVTERLPDIGKDVLIYSKEDGVDVDYYGGDMFGYWNVTHWMPLPEPPKEGV